uniref:Aspergillus nuclease S(1) n=1 Tax=Bicosoecida sp. CB-2014 TaxID=1486930 RepID=A0A7S1CI73_9STRA|mmetsp:Transcript_27660/g.95671  ORF Transcript_27660/g.95671 Transcript_27660/m.95671 type:complete len:296 (+) Transcript_27660:52-939(+)
MARLSLALLLLIAAASAAPALGWWCQGHMLTAMVAQRNISAAAMKQVGPLIAALAPEYPDSPEYITSACWADDLKSRGDHSNEAWHFINLPFVRDPMYSALDSVHNESSVGWAIQQMRSILGNSEAAQEDKARALRFLIHFVGDSHQPCHAATMYKQNQFNPPEGDRGCNLYKISGTPNQTNTTNLHFFLDGGAGQWEAMVPRPLAANSSKYLEAWTDTITAAYPMSTFAKQLAVTDVFEWLGETYYHATTFAYTTPEGQPLEDAFVMTARKLCQAQVALGGYRLAQEINAIFGS